MSSSQSKKKIVVEMDEEQMLAFEMGTALAKYIGYLQGAPRMNWAAKKPDEKTTISAEDFLRDLGGEDEDRQIGLRIKERREQLGLTQAVLAARMEISQPELSKIENGEKCLSTHRANRLAEILSVTFEWIFEGK